MIEELTAKLCAREFLAASNLSRESVLMLMNREYWEGQLGRIFPIKRRIQCREIYEICREPMSLIGREPRDGWMRFTYQYVCHILYPDEEFSRQAEPYAAGALFIWLFSSSSLIRKGRFSHLSLWWILHSCQRKRLFPTNPTQNTRNLKMLFIKNTFMR